MLLRRSISFALTVLLAAAVTGCDHEPRSTSDPARDRWAEVGPSLRSRIAELRSRQTVIGGRIGALTLPPGAEDPALAGVITELQQRLAALEPVIADVERQTGEAELEVDAALAARDKVRARKTVEDVGARLDAAYRRALDMISEIEPRLGPAEEALQRRVAGVQQEQARFDRAATAGGEVDVSAISFAADTAQLDVAAAPSKSALDRLVRLAGTCPEIRLAVRADVVHPDAAVAVTNARARAEAVRTYLVNAAVPAERVTVVNAAPGGAPPSQDRITVAVATPCPAVEPAPPAPAAAANPAAAPPTAERMPRPAAPAVR